MRTILPETIDRPTGFRALLGALSGLMLAVIPVAAAGQAGGVAAPAAPQFAQAAERAGMSAERLARLSEFMRARIAGRDVGAAVVGIMRGDTLAYLQAFGETGQGPARQALDVSAIFDLNTLTRPVTAAAALLLQERGQWLLDDPVGRHLPVLGQVGPVRLFDLARQTSGLPVSVDPPGFLVSSPAVGAPIANRRLHHSAQVAIAYTGEGFLEAIARQPLRTLPGLDWRDDFSFDVLGLAIEAASGQTLGEFFLREFFIPLDMWDTGFNPTRDVASRIVHGGVSAAPPPGQFPAAREAAPAGIASAVRDPRTPVSFECGGACLTGTASDYLRFLRMLLAGGAAGSRTLLAESSVRLMMQHQLPGSVRPTAQPGSHAEEPADPGYGLGLSIRRGPGPASLPGSQQAFDVLAVNGSFAFADPADGLALVMLMTPPTDPSARAEWPAWRLRGALRALAAQAVQPAVPGSAGAPAAREAPAAPAGPSGSR